MKFEIKTDWTVEDLTSSWIAGEMRRNPEYQRGATWKEPQKQSLIDSIFRAYPIPPIFLQEITAQGLKGPSSVYEIVDGQQRILSLSEFLKDSFETLLATDRKLRLPNSLRSGSAPWGGHKFSRLTPDLQTTFKKTPVTVFLITADAADEVRDLFVRLQAGTALTRQEVRDAWPGNLGPFIVQLAGKLKSMPEFKLPFRLDASDDDEGYDPFGPNRQFVSQLLLLYLSREKDSLNFPSLGASELDELYHEKTDFDAYGPSASRFRDLVRQTGVVCGFGTLAKDETGKNRKKAKFSKMQIFSVFCLLQDLSRSPNFKLDLTPVGPLGHYLRNAEHKLPPGRSTSGKKIQDYYEQWRRGLPADIGVRLDPNRAFNSEQKAEMLQRDGLKCAMCGKGLTLQDAEGDHYPAAWRDGGPTVVENGRLVHRACHVRGRPAAASDLIEMSDL
jgi:hypothetical protein